MREHGVLRGRSSSTGKHGRGNPASVDPKAIAQTATLFRSFGEDYHEKKLEEIYIFPAVK
jgi:hypothetical protein